MSDPLIEPSRMCCPLCRGEAKLGPLPRGMAPATRFGALYCPDPECAMAMFYVTFGSNTKHEKMEAVVGAHGLIAWHEKQLRAQYAELN